uniref:PPUP7820 n=1 Tax=Poeciliopsis prolifica TaxID=188132 RepID=A0A0S7EM93_9TELE
MRDQKSNQPFLLLLLMLMHPNRLSQLWAFPFSPSLDLDVTPRTTIFNKGMLSSNGFTGSSQNYSTLLLVGGDWASLCGRQRSFICAEHLQHLHICKPHY